MARKVDIAAATRYMQKYWGTYQNQTGYENYSDETFLADALYAIGRAMHPDKYSNGEGFQRFKNDLHTMLFKERLEGTLRHE